MKKIVCLQNVYYEGRFLSAGTDVGLPDDVARNWVERGLAKFVGEETPVNPPAQDNKADAATSDGADKLPPSANLSPDVPPEVKPEENSVVKYDFTTPLPDTAQEEKAVPDDDVPKRGRPPKKKNGGKRR